MTLDRVEEITEQIEESKEERTRAKVSIENIQKTWKEDYDVKGVKGAQQELETLEQSIETLEKREQKLDSQIESLLDDMEE